MKQGHQSTETEVGEIEARLISSCMVGGPVCVAGAVGMGIDSSTFQDGALALIWAGLVKAATEDRATGTFQVARRTFGSAIPEAGMERLIGISRLEPTSIYARSLAETVIGHSKRRKVRGRIEMISLELAKENAWQDTWKAVSGYIREAEQCASAHAVTKDLASLCDAYIEDERNGRAEGKVGIGMAEYDEYFGKLGPGEVLVMAGRPAVGKTALAIQIADNVVRNGGKAMIVSLEMNGKDLVGRIAKQRIGRNGAIAKGCSKSEYEAAKEKRIGSAQSLKEAAKRLNIFEVQETASVSRIEDRIAMLASANELPDVVVIDYLQLVQPEDSRASREQQVATISRRVKLMALAYKVPIILLSQLNRDAEKNDRRPRLSDLRESGSIEQDADRVWLLYPDPEVPVVQDSPSIQVLIEQAKNRNGVGGIAKAARFFRPAFLFERL